MSNGRISNRLLDDLLEEVAEFGPRDGDCACTLCLFVRALHDLRDARQQLALARAVVAWGAAGTVTSGGASKSATTGR